MTLPTLGSTPEWMEDAKCLTLSLEPGPNGEPSEVDRIFFPEQKGRAASTPARKFCQGTRFRGDTPCPVQAECLELALTGNERHGIWGGASQRTLKPMHEQRSKTAREARTG